MNKSISSFTAALVAILALCVAGTPVHAADSAPASPAEAKTSEPTSASAQTPAAVSDTPKAVEPKVEANATETKKEVRPDAPVALVNGKAIPKSEYDRALNAYLQTLRQSTGGMVGVNENMKGEVVGQLVDREVLFQASQKFPVDDLAQKVDEEIKGIQARFPSPETFQQALKAQNLTETELKDLVGRQISVRNYVEKQIEPLAKVSEEEVKKFYEDNKERFLTPEEVKASHILIRFPEGAKPEDEAYKKAKAKAEELQKKAAAGEDFAKLCQENSEDPGSKDQGGDLGFFTKERMVEPFATAAFALKVDQVSDVVETQFGFHVIKLTERKDAVQHGFDEVKEDITGYLKAQALDKAVQNQLAELKKAAKVEVVEANL